jgi:phage terminase small subunit
MALSSKQEQFARAFVRSGIATVAYQEAYQVGAHTLRKTVWEMASRVLNNRKVAARIAELRSAAAQDLGISLSTIAAELSQNRMNALDAGNIGLAHAATVAKAKALGFL